MKTRRIFRPGLVSLSLFLLALSGVSGEKAVAQQRDQVRLILDWVIGGSHTPYFYAIKKGFYRDANLDVQISRGYGGADGIKRIAAGEGDINIGETSAVIQARAAGGNVKLTAVMYQDPPYAIYSLKSSGIRTPKDLEGRSIGAPVFDSVRFLFPAFAAINKIDPAKVRWVTIGPGAKISALIAGKVDAITFFIFQDVRLAKVTASKGGANRIAYADHGFSIYSNGLISSEAYLQKKGDVVRRFLTATIKGYHATFANQGEAIDNLLKGQPLLDRDIVTGEVNEMKKLVLTKDTREHGLGWVSPKKMAHTRDFITKYFKLDKSVPVEEIYTLNYLPNE